MLSRLNFGGFYYSNHSESIDSMVRNYFTDEEGNETEEEGVNYHLLHELYCKEMVNFLNEKFDINMKFDTLQSPKYYNYSTDCIIVNVTKKDAKKVIKAAGNIDAEIIDVTTEKSGYIPLYTFDEIKADDSRLFELSMDIYFNSDDFLDEWLQYYDYENIYELIYRDGVIDASEAA